jgi:hypothetical protein
VTDVGIEADRKRFLRTIEFPRQWRLSGRRNFTFSFKWGRHMKAIGMFCRTGLPLRTAAAALAASTLLVAGPASAKEINLARTVKSGVDTRVAFSGRWDTHTCKALPMSVTISKQPSHGTASIVPGVQTMPQSTPGSGPTACAGAKIDSNQIMYKSNGGFHGADLMGYHTDTGIDATITITVE